LKGKFSKEASIRKPTQIFGDSTGAVEASLDNGKEILFSEKDIARIAFFEEV
jgi:hypothetical protein